MLFGRGGGSGVMGPVHVRQAVCVRVPPPEVLRFQFSVSTVSRMTLAADKRVKSKHNKKKKPYI